MDRMDFSSKGGTDFQEAPVWRRIFDDMGGGFFIKCKASLVKME